jgi:hypothetical protein
MKIQLLKHSEQLQNSWKNEQSLENQCMSFIKRKYLKEQNSGEKYLKISNKLKIEK